MPGQQPVLPHLPRVGQPGVGLLRLGRAGRAVLRRKAEGGEGTVERKLLEDFGKALERFAVLDKGGCPDQAIDRGGVRGVLQGT